MSSVGVAAPVPKPRPKALAPTRRGSRPGKAHPRVRRAGLLRTAYREGRAACAVPRHGPRHGPEALHGRLHAVCAFGQTRVA